MLRILSARTVRLGLLVAVLALPVTAFAQHEAHSAADSGIESNAILNGLEILTGMAAAAVAFQAALAYREGQLGKGMTWVAVGMTVMSLGHLILVVKREGLDPLGFLGATGSFIAFSCAVFASFLASAFGFWMIRKAALSR